MVHQPDPEKKPNMLAGLVAIRKMHIRAIEESEFTCADEMLYPENWRYLSDLLSYVAVGARSVEDQQHRLTVSGMDVPAGMKNPTSGDYSVMLNSVVAAQGSHTFIYRGWEVETTGNELTHTILRGAVNKHGEAIPNYHYEDLRLLFEKYSAKNLKNMATIVDTNHSNPTSGMSSGSVLPRKCFTAVRLILMYMVWLRGLASRELLLSQATRRRARTMYMANLLQMHALDGMSLRSCCILLLRCADKGVSGRVISVCSI